MNSLNTRNRLELDVIWRQVTGQLTDSEIFIGFLESQVALTAIPTTARHMGIFMNRSAADDYLLSSADNATQSTTSTGTAGVNSQFRLNINWTGSNAGVITLFQTAPGFTSEIASHTATALGSMDARAYTLHFYVETEGSTAKAIDIFEWRLSTT